MSATQLPLFAPSEPSPLDRLRAEYDAATAAHLPLCTDRRCLTDSEHWRRTGIAQQAVEDAYHAWKKAGGV